MNIFLKYNRKNIQDRQIDTLIGLSKGLIADGSVNQAEAEFLYNWLIQNKGLTENPLIINLYEKVSSMLEDNELDSDESDELFKILHKLSGDSSEIGEVAKTSSLPLDEPMPPVEFSGKSFLFTGLFAFGNRKKCQEQVDSLGGTNANSVTKNLDYLVLGTYVNNNWAHETYGRKIEKAVANRNNGLPVAIISEQHWLDESKL
mgnify:CR=1 FL=1